MAISCRLAPTVKAKNDPKPTYTPAKGSAACALMYLLTQFNFMLKRVVYRPKLHILAQRCKDSLDVVRRMRMWLQLEMTAATNIPIQHAHCAAPLYLLGWQAERPSMVGTLP